MLKSIFRGILAGFILFGVYALVIYIIIGTGGAV